MKKLYLAILVLLCGLVFANEDQEFVIDTSNLVEVIPTPIVIYDYNALPEKLKQVTGYGYNTLNICDYLLKKRVNNNYIYEAVDQFNCDKQLVFSHQTGKIISQPYWPNDKNHISQEEENLWLYYGILYGDD